MTRTVHGSLVTSESSWSADKEPMRRHWQDKTEPKLLRTSSHMQHHIALVNAHVSSFPCSFFFYFYFSFCFDVSDCCVLRSCFFDSCSCFFFACFWTCSCFFSVGFCF